MEIRVNVSTARRLRWTRTEFGLATVLLTATLTACTKEGDARQAQEPVSSDLPAVLATVGDQQITLADVRARVGTPLATLETQYQRARSKLVDSTLQLMLNEKIIQLEAAKTGKTAEELLAAEVGGSLEPGDVEIAAWYEDNQLRLGGRSLESIRPQIAEYIRVQRRRDAAQKLEQRLSKDLNVTVNFEPYQLVLDNEGAPTLGKEGAPVQVVEFSDFQCPFCQRFAPTLKRLAQEFGDRVHIVYRQYPIPSLHPNAIKAAEASLCANEQGKFWELHDVMFAEQERLDVTDLKEKAGRLGMNRKAFDSCLDSGRYVERVQKDMQEGLRIGITGTPAVFVNGNALDGGAVPYETVTAAVQRELTRAQRRQ